jgi:hypothetical protein
LTSQEGLIYGVQTWTTNYSYATTWEQDLPCGPSMILVLTISAIYTIIEQDRLNFSNNTIKQK